MNIIFEEKNSSQIMTVAFLVGIAAFLFGAYTYWQEAVYKTEDAVVLGVIGIVIAVIFYTFHSLRIVLYEDRLQFGFGPFKKTVKKGEIKQAEQKKYKFGNYLGYGIRRGMDKSWGYVVGGGEGIMIHLEDKKFFFNTENPDELLQLIKQQLM